MTPHFYAPRERVVILDKMIVVRRGRMVVKLHFLGRDDVWGHKDILLQSPLIIDATMPRTLTYTDVLTLKKQSLKDTCRHYPLVDARLRRAQIRIAAWRAFVLESRDRVHPGPSKKHTSSKHRLISFSNSEQAEQIRRPQPWRRHAFRRMQKQIRRSKV